MNEATQSDAEMGPNPFSVTKAGYFTDAEIHSTWVDWPAPGGFAHLVSVHSRMPRFILGGKGSGRTHMMRHFSAPVQVARGGGDGVRQVQTDGVVGVYIMCSNLDASRFGDGRDDSVSWQFLFTQYMDLWLALADLDAFELLTAAKPLSAKDEKAAASEILELVGADATEEVADLNRVRSVFEQLRRRIDQVVNDSMLNPSTSLEVTAHSSVGRLVFEVPRILKRYYEDLSAVIWLYLIDEHENLGASQQQYINSLVRESVPGVSFAVGVRRYGLRTHTVIGGLEENRRGSEFDEIRLDRVFGGDSDLYRTFCMGIVKRRLTDAGSSSIGNTTEFGHDLVRAFERRDNSWVERQVTARYEPMERPYMLKLKQQLQRYGGSAGDGVLTQTAVDEVLQSVSVPERPMLEKANILLLYREWAAGRDVMEAAEQLRKEQAGVSQTKGDNASDRQRRVLQYFASDLRAQLHRDMRLRGSQYYSGIEEFIRMSDHLPRNLLVILKNVYRWSLFFDERPFAGRPISLEAQRMGHMRRPSGSTMMQSRWVLTVRLPTEQWEEWQTCSEGCGSVISRLRAPWLASAPTSVVARTVPVSLLS